MQATCYHLRAKNNGNKILGGSLPRGMDLNAAAKWLIDSAVLSVSNSGRVHYMYGGKEVWVYLSVDPAETDKGKAALKAWRAEKQSREDAAAEVAEEAEREIEELTSTLGVDEVLRRLRGAQIMHYFDSANDCTLAAQKRADATGADYVVFHESAKPYRFAFMRDNADGARTVPYLHTHWATLRPNTKG